MHINVVNTVSANDFRLLILGRLTSQWNRADRPGGGCRYPMPGFSLHEELGFLVEAGLSPLEALRAATIGPARYMTATDSLGSVEVGKIADLVVLDADLLQAVGNARRIHGVVLNGRFLDRRELDALLEQAEAAANRQGH